MLNQLLTIFAKGCIRLRYRVRLVGAKAVAEKGRRGILFLPNHPGLIDPIILVTHLQRTFGVRALADKDQIDRFFIRYLARRARVVPIPDPVKYGRATREKVREGIDLCAEALRQGDNLVVYPSGHISRDGYDHVAGNSAVAELLQRVPDARVVLVAQKGVWGTSFSWASGHRPRVSKALKHGLWKMLLSGGLFMPRRRVTIELHEVDDLPRDDRDAVNGYLETFYRAHRTPNTYVPYTPWERGGRRQLPEPRYARPDMDPAEVSPVIRGQVLEQLRQLSGVEELNDDLELAGPLGMDSLARADLTFWLSGEFGSTTTNADALRTVGDAVLAAAGIELQSDPTQLEAPAVGWTQPLARRPALADGADLAEAFWANAGAFPGRAILADPTSGVRTYRDVVTAMLVLVPRVADLPGERVGILMPATVAADMLYLATVLAGKTPVMINWTVGPRNLAHCLELAGAERVLSARKVVDRLGQQGVDLSAVAERLELLEDWGKRIGRLEKLGAWLRSRLGLWGKLRRRRPADTAAILFTSGSEAMPKGVPLSHGNILANLAGALERFELGQDDRLLGMLPPFHSFGLTTGIGAPLAAGLPVVHYPNPTESRALADVIETYRVTVLIATPTFLAGIVRSADPGQLAGLRLCITGAEKCPASLYEKLRRACPDAVVLEGYGTTECAPIVAVNPQDRPKVGTIGPVLSSYESLRVDPETGRPVGAGERGELLVAGPCVFDGYLGSDAPDPFVELGGTRYYRTGDLVTEDADGYLTFAGRRKRFAKIGGEMVSLPAIEEVLNERFGGETDEGPVLALEAAGEEGRPELVLFASGAVTREQANVCIREAGLSAIHNIRRVVKVEEIPVLGTGKTDYRALRRRLAELQ